MMKFLANLGARLWENHGFWVDKENNITQRNYFDLPLLGKFGYRLMVFALKHDEKLNESFEFLKDD